MSLTGLLGSKTSPLRIWFDKTFPNTKEVCRDGRWAASLAVPPTVQPGWAGTVGAAFDYRFRWFWPSVPFRELTAAFGGGAMGVAYIAEEIDKFCGSVTPTAGLLDGEAEERLIRIALILAQLESVFRSGRLLDAKRSGIAQGRSLKEMLAVPPHEAVADVRAMTELARTSAAAILSGSAILNPALPLSRLVGGADADLIVDGTLIDLKTTQDVLLSPQDIRQLLGYVLLDDGDSLEIERVALYFARRPQLSVWQADDLIARCAGVGVPRDDLRAGMRMALARQRPSPTATAFTADTE